jgi:hypothetical protein
MADPRAYVDMASPAGVRSPSAAAAAAVEECGVGGWTVRCNEA